MSGNYIRLAVLLELTGWMLTLLVIVGVLYPIRVALPDWPFQTWNIIFIVVLITLGRYIFLLKHTFLAKMQYLKFVLIILMVPGIFMLISGLNGFMVWIEEHTWEPLTGHLPLEQQQKIEAYAWNQMIFFGAGSIIAALAFIGRLFMSIWLTHNRGRA